MAKTALTALFEKARAQSDAKNVSEVRAAHAYDENKPEYSQDQKDTEESKFTYEPFTDEDLTDLEREGYIDITTKLSHFVMQYTAFTYKVMSTVYYHPVQDLFLITSWGMEATETVEPQDVIPAMLEMELLNNYYTKSDADFDIDTKQVANSLIKLRNALILPKTGETSEFSRIISSEPDANKELEQPEQPEHSEQQPEPKQPEQEPNKQEMSED